MRAVIELDPEPASVRSARRFVTETLHDTGQEHYSDVATLLVSELVTNAVLHAGTPISMVVEADPPWLRVAVKDDARGQVARRRFAPDASTGRGLSLVDALAAAWGADTIAGDGKVVWFELH